MRDIKKKIKCMFGRHDDIIIHVNDRYQISQCKVCGKYEVYHMGLGLLYRCTWEQLPYSYKF